MIKPTNSHGSGNTVGNNAKRTAVPLPITAVTYTCATPGSSSHDILFRGDSAADSAESMRSLNVACCGLTVITGVR
jgi:hypothetical protein